MKINIKELVKQSTSYTWNGNDVDEEFDEDLFAELIIKHCASQCDPETGLKYSPNSLSSRLDCKQKILSLLE